MAGGECLSLETGTALVEGISCFRSGIFCLRKPAECEGAWDARCCQLMNGKKTPNGGRAGCDRGYLSCAGRSDTWVSSSDLCENVIENPDESAPTKWPGAVSSLIAAKWACDEAGGQSVDEQTVTAAVEKGEPICKDGHHVAFHSLGACCIPKTACPETNPDIECCKASGTLEDKICQNARADCDGITLGTGLVKEVKAGTCKPYSL